MCSGSKQRPKLAQIYDPNRPSPSKYVRPFGQHNNSYLTYLLNQDYDKPIT